MNWRFGFLSLVMLAGCKSAVTDEASSESKISSVLFSSESQFPIYLSDVNIFVNGLPNRPVPALRAYDVGVPFWSDGAVKSRYVMVPSGKKLSRDRDSGEIQFPTGTTFVKHFAMDSGEPLETRIITRKEDKSWGFATYLWNDDGTSAEFSDCPKVVTKNKSTFHIPSEQECQMCHAGKNPIRGFNLSQLNFEPSPGKNQIDVPSILRLFSETPSELKVERPLDDPANKRLSISRRARSYMEVNCSACHNPDGPKGANELDMRLDAIDTHLLTEKKVAPGDPKNSIVWQKVSGDADRMPPVSMTADPIALQIFRQYIEEWGE